MPEAYSIWQKCMAEAIGAGIIVAGGCGTVCAWKFANWPMGPLGVPFSFGTSVALAIYMTRDVSGAHLNPAITASLALNRPKDCPKNIVAPYIASQVAGATVAGGLNYAIYKRHIAAFEATQKIVRGAPGSYSIYNGAFGMIPCKTIRPLGALALEIGMTAALAFVIFGVTDIDKTVPVDAGPALIGLTVAGLAGQFAPLTGCGMNPARDLGPRLVTAATGWGSQAWHPAWWTYSVGPIMGAILGGSIYRATLEKRNVL